MSCNHGYARVSSKEQNLDRQVKALKEFGCHKLYCDKQSGKDFERVAYKKMIKAIKPNDVLVVKSIDRLGRNYGEILDQWRTITKDKNVDIVVLDMPLLDTRKKDGGLTGEFLSDLVLQILSYVAEMERSFNKQRQAEGIAIARDKGVKFGRPKKPAPSGFELAKEEYIRGELTSRQACKKCGVPQTTFLRWVKESKL